MSLTLGAALALGAGSSAVNLGGSFLGSLFNKKAAESSLAKQVQASKELLDYEQSRYLSPKAQVANLANAGINPAAAFSNTAPVNVGGSMAMPTAPIYGLDVGTQSLGDVASLLVGAAQAKKAGVEIPQIEAETQGKVLDNERQEFENHILKIYGLKKSAAELALAEQQVKLAASSTDLNEQEKAKKSWETAKEKALSECSERQRDLLQKELANKDTELNLRNEYLRQQNKTEQSKQSANYAAAESSKAAASNYRQQARVNEILADIQEATKVDNINAALIKLESENAISQADLVEARRKAEAISHVRDGSWRQEVDNFLEWLKGKISIFGK